MNLLAGSEAEHAVLLTNFFSGMGKKAYFVLGQVKQFLTLMNKSLKLLIF